MAAKKAARATVSMAKKASAKKSGAKSASAKKSGAKKSAAKKSAPARRADFGQPINAFFTKQPPHLRPIVEALRALVEETVPDATASLKWGMPFYTRGREMMCAIAGHKAHVNLILAGPPDAYADPDGLLEGEAKGGRHLKLRALDDLPRAQVKAWLKRAAQIAGGKAH